jgi:predicted nucleic acid-binding protein
MNLVDTSALVEFFLDTPQAARFAAAVENTARLLVPSIVIFELYKTMSRIAGTDAADAAVMALRRGVVVALDERHALAAARVSARHNLAMADSIIYATAAAHSATLWTQDEHFKGLPNVRYFPKTTS